MSWKRRIAPYPKYAVITHSPETEPSILIPQAINESRPLLLTSRCNDTEKFIVYEHDSALYMQRYN